MGALSFPRSHHLKRPRDFRAVFHRGVRRQARGFTCLCLPNPLGHPRLGVSASRKIGGAVVRNRVKRLVREAFRLHWRRWGLGGLDLVVIARRGSVDLAFSDVVRDLSAPLSPRGTR